MDIKLIATDLDGTLMQGDHLTVSEKTKSALLECSKRKIKTAISTGRTLSLIDNVTEQIPFIDYIIYSNGAGCYDCSAKKVIYQDNISSEISNKLLELFSSMPIYYEFYAEGKVHIDSARKQYFSLNSVPQEFADAILSLTVEHTDMVKFRCNKETEKINLFNTPNEYLNQIKAFIADGDKLEYTSSIEGNVEINKAGTNKGKALLALCNHLNISVNNTMCFGDGGNDVEIMAVSPNSYAMGNAEEQVKKAAAHVTLDNTEDGVAVVLLKLLSEMDEKSPFKKAK